MKYQGEKSIFSKNHVASYGMSYEERKRKILEKPIGKQLKSIQSNLFCTSAKKSPDALSYFSTERNFFLLSENLRGRKSWFHRSILRKKTTTLNLFFKHYWWILNLNLELYTKWNKSPYLQRFSSTS